MREDGSTVVLSMIFLLIILILIGTLATLITGQVQYTEYNINKVKAGYNAEAAIEKAINFIELSYYNNGILITDPQLLADQDNGWQTNGSYRIQAEDVNVPGGFGEYYCITAHGQSKNVQKDVTVHITPWGNKTGAAIVSGTKVEKDYLKGKLWTTYISAFVEDAFVNPIDEDDSSYFDGGTDITTLPVVNIDYNKIKIDPEEIDPGITGGKFYYDNDRNSLDRDVHLIIDDGSQTGVLGIENYGEIIENYQKIFVDGDLTLHGIRKVYNTIFVVTGDFYFELASAWGNLENVFIYVGGSINITKGDYNNDAAEPYLVFKGQMIAQCLDKNLDKVIIHTKDGKVSYKEIPIPANFDNLIEYTLFDPRIVYWEESVHIVN